MPVYSIPNKSEPLPTEVKVTKRPEPEAIPQENNKNEIKPELNELSTILSDKKPNEVKIDMKNLPEDKNIYEPVVIYKTYNTDELTNKQPNDLTYYKNVKMPEYEQLK